MPARVDGITRVAEQASNVIIMQSGQVSSAGDNILIQHDLTAEISGYRMKYVVTYASYNPVDAAVTAYFKFESLARVYSDPFPLTFLRNHVSAGSVIAKDFSSGAQKCETLDLEDIILNLDAAVLTNWNIFYYRVRF